MDRMSTPGMLPEPFGSRPTTRDLASLLSRWSGHRVSLAPGDIYTLLLLNFCSSGPTVINFTVPKSTPSGTYLVRGEHIGLHAASTSGGAQFYIACGQVNVTGGGNGTPGPLVAFPGAYKASDPGILININYPVPTSYTPPGPAVWSG